MTNTVSKTIDTQYVLRVSGKGDTKASQNQLEVLQGHLSDPDVAWFLANFDVRMMKASDPEGARLRAEWSAKHGLVVLRREGRADFLGVRVDRHRARFMVYASTAAGLDENESNAFTRHLCDSISDPRFHGLADPTFMARRDAGAFDAGDHPSRCVFFDVTRAVRSTLQASKIFETALDFRAGLEVQGLLIDPAVGSHQRMQWSFMASGAEMEAEIGRLRRFVGRLNKARAGQWCYREGMAPLGARRAPVGDVKGNWALEVDPAQVAAVAALLRLGLTPGLSARAILDELSTRHGVVSGDPKTLGVPLNELGTAALRRLLLRRKLLAYRDGELALSFVGVQRQCYRPGSGHVLRRRWEGLRDGQVDLYGAVTYMIPFPKPEVTGPDGSPRRGWVDGVTDQDERQMWDRLIRDRGVAEPGRGLEEEELLGRGEDSSTGRRGGRQPARALSALLQPWVDDGSRMFLRSRSATGAGASYELFRERGPAGRNGGIRRDDAELVARFAEDVLTGAVAEAITDAVNALTADGHDVVAHKVQLPASLSAPRSPAQSHDELATELAGLEALAAGYDLTVAELRGRGTAEDHPRLKSAEAAAAQAWERVEALARKVKRQVVAHPAEAVELPALDAADPRDLVVGLRTVFATGEAPAGFLAMLRATLPTGVRLLPGPDGLEWVLEADVSLSLADGERLSVAGRSRLVPSRHGRGAGGQHKLRAERMARRFFSEGQPLDDVAAAGSTTPHLAAAALHAHLLSTGHVGDPALAAQAVACPLPAARRAIWKLASGIPPAGAFEAHLASVYRGDGRATAATSGRGVRWAYDPDTDYRRDQLTIALAAPDPARGVRADALAHALHPAQPRDRAVRHASTAVTKVNATYPPALERLPAPGHPVGWYGRAAGSVPDRDKWLAPVRCPFDDCDELFATALVPAVEVLALGAMMLCRACRRVAVPRVDPGHVVAARTPFPDEYLHWSPTPSRTGAAVLCSSPGCQSDVGLGPGKAWQWAGDSTPGVHRNCVVADGLPV